MVNHTRLYRNGKLVREGFPIAEVHDHLHEEGAIVWFDLCSPPPEKLALIGKELGLHELAVRNARIANQRPRLVTFDTHMFLNVYATRYDRAAGDLELTEVSAFITANALVTVRASDAFSIKGLLDRWDCSPGLADHSVAFLLHGLLDYVVDTHFEVVQAIDDQIEELEDQLFNEEFPDRLQQRRTFELRQNLVKFRRVVMPVRDVVVDLFRPNNVIKDAALTPYFQDVYDHVLRAAEWTDSLRDLVSNIREAHMTMQSNKMNLIMKHVTSWAAIIAVPTAITGFYGQNVPFPGLGEPWGFWTSTAVWIAAALVLYWQFRKRDWL